MKRLTIRLFSVLLLIAMILSFAACTKQGEGPDGTESTTSDGTTKPDDTNDTEAKTDEGGNNVGDKDIDENGFIKDRLPDSVKYPGKTVTFLAWDGQSYEEFSVDALTDDPVNDAIYRRNNSVKERLGVSLNFIKTKGGSDDYAAFSDKVKSDIQGGDDYTYDMIAAYSRTTTLCAYNGYTRDLLSTKYFDEEMPWWPETLRNQSTINGKLYFCSGDISLSLFHNLDIIYVNKKIAQDYGTSCDDMYKMVEDHEWTLDKMISLTKGVYKDLDGDTVKSKEDQFGFIAANTQSQPLVWGCGIVGVEFDGNKMVTSPSFTGEKMQKVIEKIFTWLHTSQDAMYASSTGDGNTAFENGRLLFFSNIATYTMSRFADVDFDIGILPPPLYDERQEDYYSVIGNAFSLYAILKTNTDPDMCSAVLECMASEGYRQISPAVFTAAMKIKYAKDDMTSKMYDIIRSGVIFDNARMFSSIFDNLYTKTYNDAIKYNDTDWSKRMKSIEKQLQTKLDEINKTFAEMN